MPKTNTNLGFTLIELLVVVSIIGFLSSILLTTVHTARFKARDNARAATIHNLTNALELYYQDHGKFPCHNISFSNETGNFMQAFVDAGLVDRNPADPDNLQVPLEYATFKTSTTPGSPCGQIAHFGIYLENATSCPEGGVPDPADHSVPNPLGGYYLHCHYFYPEPLPPPCPNPYWLTDQAWPNSCSRLMDSTNEY